MQALNIYTVRLDLQPLREYCIISFFVKYLSLQSASKCASLGAFIEHCTELFPDEEVDSLLLD
jgi:hypothetical protein